MALPAQSYVWFRIRHVVGLWVARETGLSATSILWDNQNQPSPGLPCIGLERREFPFEYFDDEDIREVPTQVTLTVTASAAGETASFVLFGLRYAYTLQVGDTTEDARDALLALVANDVLQTAAANDGHLYGVGFQPCTATGSGLDAIVFAGVGLGAIGVDAVENTSLVVDTLAYRHIQSGLRRAIVRLHLYWPERQDAFDTIDEYAEALRSAIVTEDAAAWLAARGVGVTDPARVRIQDASAVSGANRQRRKFLDITFNSRARIYRDLASLDEATPPAIEIV